MDQEEIDKVVLVYLDRRGFKQAGLAFQQEKQQNTKGSDNSSNAQIDPEISKQILAFSDFERTSRFLEYQEGYNKLRSWAYNSLDQYQYELVSVLYPVFVHGFMDLVAKDHISEAFEETMRLSMHMTSKIRGCSFSVTSGGNGICTFPKTEQSEHEDMSSKFLPLIIDAYYSYKVLIQPTSAIFTQVSINYYAWNHQQAHQLSSNLKIQWTVSPGQPSSIADDTEFVALSAWLRLNCASISSDGSLVAGGFSDSSLKVWNMALLGQQNEYSSLQGENELAPAPNGQIRGNNTGERPYTLFRVHCGPIHSATFSPFGNFLLSSSSDLTIRLWSMNFNANLVCYKGHNYPVWDVQLS